MKSPVLFLIFNRPDTTAKVFETIRKARPPRLYVAADGARLDREGEKQICQETREIVSQVDWPCEVFTLFREQNLGCKQAVSSAINWFFEQEEEGIILEDDILVLPSFFRYCDEMLDYYRDNPNVGMISGDNFIGPYFSLHESYFFSKYNFIWGWATWRRAWIHYDVDMKDWPEWYQQNNLKKYADGNIFFEGYWKRQFDAVYSGQLDTWDYQWIFTSWKMGCLTILPRNNLVTNLGFDNNATHTTGDIPEYVVNAVPKELDFPLTHVNKVERSILADQLLSKVTCNITVKAAFINFLCRTPLFPLLKKIRNIFR